MGSALLPLLLLFSSFANIIVLLKNGDKHNYRLWPSLPCTAKHFDLSLYILFTRWPYSLTLAASWLTLPCAIWSWFVRVMFEIILHGIKSINFRNWWQQNCYWSMCNTAIALKAMFYLIVLIQITAATITGRNIKDSSLENVSPHVLVL